MEDKNERKCKKCLVREQADSNRMFETISQYIENLEEERRADERLYNERLSICKECERLLEAMCSACGCYVEIRASVKQNICPYNQW